MADPMVVGIEREKERENRRKRSRVYCPRKNCHRAYTVHIYLDGGAS